MMEQLISSRLYIAHPGCAGGKVVAWAPIDPFNRYPNAANWPSRAHKTTPPNVCIHGSDIRQNLSGESAESSKREERAAFSRRKPFKAARRAICSWTDLQASSALHIRLLG
jgi:hypothetical protein